MNRLITLRPVRDQDEEFLYTLYKLSRVEEFAIANLSEAQFEMLMRMQYAARKGSYEGNYPSAHHDVIAVDGMDAGQIWISRDGSQIRVIDISIAAAFQNQGIGGALMRDLMAEAQRAGIPIRCSVATNNPGSLRFHQRLGFRITSEDLMYHQLEHP